MQPQSHTQTWRGTPNHCHTHCHPTGPVPQAQCDFKYNGSLTHRVAQTQYKIRHKHNTVSHMARVTVTILLTHSHSSTHIFSQPHRSPTSNPTEMLTHTKVHTYTQGLTKDIRIYLNSLKSTGVCTVNGCHHIHGHTHTTDTTTSNHKHADRQRRIPHPCQL